MFMHDKKKGMNALSHTVTIEILQLARPMIFFLVMNKQNYV